jgi:aminopeptidase N
MDRLREFSCRHFARHLDEFAGPEAEQHYPPDLELEPMHLDVALALDLEGESAAGTVTTTVAARRPDADTLELDAVDFEDVTVQDVEGRALESRYDGRRIRLRWSEPFAAGEERRIAVRYRVARPTSGLFFSKPTDAYPDQPWFAATDHETERARHWLPCVDHPSVRTTVELHLRAESRFTILANGIVTETDYDDGWTTVHWRLEQRCPSYLICFAIGDFVTASDGDFEGIPVAYFATRRFREEDLLRTFGRTKDMLAWMTRKLDMPFPFPKYYQFALPDFGGAMENISLVSWDDRAVLDETLAKEWSFHVDQVNVHEMAHSYFGNTVVCRDFAHAWLKESWATYMEQCWLEDKRGADWALYDYYSNAQAYFTEADERYMRPIVTRRFKSSWQMYDRHLYPGGACRLHTLRHELGDEVFWGAVRDYLNRYAGEVVETDDFRRVLEERSGRSLGRFFDQWFASPGYPILKVSFSYDEHKRQGRFEIEQKQVDKEKGIEAFRLATELGWTVNGQEHLQPITLSEPKHSFVVPMAGPPEQVRFDPNARVLHKLEFNPGDPMLRAQLREAQDVIGRILAARELVKTGKGANLQAVVDRYPSEPFWGVRREMAKALGEAGSETAVAGLVGIAALEQDPLVLEAVFRAAAQYRDQRVRDAVEARVREGLPYRAAQAALQALGAQREAAPWDLLVERAGQEDFSGLVQSGALQGLAATRRAEAVDLLLERVRYGASVHRVRPAAIGALADSGRMQERARREPVVECMIDLLRDPVPSARRAAARGLKALQASEAIGALEAYRGRVAVQEQVEIDRLLDSLRAGEKPKEAGAEKQLLELQEKYRSLEDRLRRLEDRLQSEGAAS